MYFFLSLYSVLTCWNFHVVVSRKRMGYICGGGTKTRYPLFVIRDENVNVRNAVMQTEFQGSGNFPLRPKLWNRGNGEKNMSSPRDPKVSPNLFSTVCLLVYFEKYMVCYSGNCTRLYRGAPFIHLLNFFLAN